MQEKVLTDHTTLVNDAMPDILEQMEDGVIIADLKGNILHMNVAAVKIHGYEKKSDYLKHISKIEDTFEVRSYPENKLLKLKDWPISKLLKGKQTHADVYLRRLPTGATVIVRYEARLVRNKDDQAYLAVLTVRDITDTMKAQEQILANEEKYQAFVSNSTEAIWRCEVTEPIPTILGLNQQLNLMYKHGYLAEANQAMADMYGLASPDSLIGMKLSDLLVRSDPKNTEYLKAFIKSGYRLNNMESHERDVEGNDKYFRNSLVGVVSNGKLLRAWGTQHDITEQVKARQELTTINQRFKLLFDNAPEAIILSDTEGKCHQINLATTKLLGYSSEDLHGKRLIDIISPRDLPRLKEERAKGTPSGYYQHEWELIRKDGQPVFTEIRSQQLPAKEWIAFVRDISQRKAAEDALLTSEERFRTLIERSHDAVALLSKEGFFEYVSPGVSDILGYTPEEIIGRNAFDFVYAEESQELGSLFKEILSHPNKSITVEHRYKNNKGDYVWIETIATNLLDDKNIGAIVSNFSNINERKQSEAELAYQTDLLETVIDNTTLGFFMMDEHHKCTYMNRVAREMTGYKLSEIQAGSLHNYIHYLKTDGSDYPITDCPIDSALPTRKVVRGEETFIKKSGEFFPVRFNASPLIKNDKPVGTIIEIQDISEELQAQQALIESNEQFRQLADSMPQIVWSAYSRDGADYYNQRWYEFTGFRKNDDRGWQDIIHPDDYPAFTEAWKESIETGQPFEIEFRLQGQQTNGDYRLFLCRAVPVRDTEGTVMRWYGTCTDIEDIHTALQTNIELEQAAIRLMEQKDALIALGKAKDDFISLASHQLRTPATAVKAYTGMLIEGYAGDLTNTQTKYLKQAYDSNERQLQTIDDLLNVAQIDTGQFTLNKEQADVVSLMSDVINEQADKFKRREQKVSFETSEASVIANVDAARLRMVFENLIDNASKYTHNGKRIDVSISKPDADACTVTIKDQGVGIEQGDMDRLFQKFSRIGNLLSEAVGGTGLGLYWAKKIVDLHGGSIDVKSKKDSGTTFVITLPLK